MTPHIFHESLTRSKAFQIKANGQVLDVLHHPDGDWTSFECDGPLGIEIQAGASTDKAIIHPLNRGIQSESCNGSTRFTLSGPQFLMVEIPNQPLLFIYAHPPAPKAPVGDHVRLFKAGEVYEAGEIRLQAGEICWIEPGALVRGFIRASNVSGVQIGGYGVLDGSYKSEFTRKRRLIIIEYCQDVKVADILMLSPAIWMLVLAECNGVEVNRVRQIADGYGSDGIDIVGSRHVHITGCCLRNGDDNIAIKSGVTTTEPDGHTHIWNGLVEDVRVSDSIFYNTLGGSAMEIGFELSTDLVHDIRFENIDVLAVHQFGSVFGIHNGDHATVENVTWENIRVEHHYDKLVDFRTLFSRWNKDTERGHIRNITLRNIQVSQNYANMG